MAQLAEYQEEYATELKAIQLQHEQALNTHQQQALVQLQELHLRQTGLLAERDSAHERELERFHAMHAEAMTDGQLQRSLELCDLKDDHAKELADLSSLHATKVHPLVTIKSV